MATKVINVAKAQNKLTTDDVFKSHASKFFFTVDKADLKKASKYGVFSELEGTDKYWTRIDREAAYSIIEGMPGSSLSLSLKESI